MSDLPSLVAKVYNVLEPLGSEERQKVVSSVLMLLGENPLGRPSSQNERAHVTPNAPNSFGPNAGRWMQQHAIEISVLEKHFHKEGDVVQVIAPKVVGTTKKEQAKNCYLLTGVKSLLGTDSAKFSDSDAIALCKHMGCYDLPNHSRTRGELGNFVAGTKSQGYTLAAPGLRAAAELLKAMD